MKPCNGKPVLIFKQVEPREQYITNWSMFSSQPAPDTLAKVGTNLQIGNPRRGTRKLSLGLRDEDGPSLPGFKDEDSLVERSRHTELLADAPQHRRKCQCTSICVNELFRLSSRMTMHQTRP